MKLKKNDQHNMKLVKTILILLIVFSVTAFAQTGKIIGKVIDKATGEPLIGANVMVVGTTIGTATDIEGNYQITNIPVGSYSLAASYIGFNKSTVTNVQVNLNRHTKIYFELTSTAFTSEEVVVTAQTKAVDVEVASSAKLITSKDIQNMPTLTNVEELLTLQSGVVNTGDGLHIRGGQSNEVLYLIDGVPAKNPVTGMNALTIDVNQIENVEILTGGFDAEYGNAQSGVINIITKSGKTKYSVESIIKSDQPFGNSLGTNYDYGYVGISGPMKLFDLIGMPGKGSFNVSVKTELDDTNYKIGGGYGETNLGLFSNDNRQFSLYNISGRIDYKPWKDFRMKISYFNEKNNYKWYDWAWKNIPENLPISVNKSQQLQGIFTHTIGEDMFYQLSLSYSKYNTQTGLMDVNDPTERFGYEYKYFDSKGNPILSPDNYDAIDHSRTKIEFVKPTKGIDIDSDGFMDSGEDHNYFFENSEVFNVKFDLTSYVGVHKLKTGFNIDINKVDKLDIYNFGYYFAGRDTIPGAWSEYGDQRWAFNDIPWNGSVYIQDNIEYAGMYLNIGVRGDFYFHGEKVNDPDFIRMYNEVTGSDIKEFDRMKFEWSPRIGLSIPASTSTKLFFNYGYFTQLPSLNQLYLDPFLTTTVGNPDLKPKKDISYEVGLESEFMEDWVLKVKLYGRDFGGSISTVLTDTDPVRKVFDNTGFGSSRGFEAEIRKVYNNYWAFTINYTYLMARGFDLSDLQGYTIGSTITPPPIREQRVSYDINNTLNMMLNFNVGPKDEVDLLGMPLKDFGVSVTANFFSGIPFSPTIPGAIYVEPYSDNSPYFLNVDATINKGFTIGNTRIQVFIEAKNLLDISNIRVYNRRWPWQINNGFNTRTGEIYNLGDLKGETDQFLHYQEILYKRANQSFKPGMRLRFGLKIYVN